MGVLQKVHEPTDLVNSMVLVKKKKTGKLSICLDPHDLGLNSTLLIKHFEQ